MFPFKELPYPAAPFWCFPLMELSMCIFLVACAIHAWRRHAGLLAYLLGGVAFGFLLEYFEVVTDSYTYGRFWLMVGHSPALIPLWVGFAWGIIMYTARLFSDAAGLPLFSAAAFDTLLALNIDLGLDAVAYRLHMWHWDWTHSGRNPLTADWFGIPYGNFVGWITVVFCYSVFSRLLERGLLRRGQNRLRTWSVPLLATACSLAVLIGTELLVFPLLNKIGIRSGTRLVLLVVLLLLAAIAGWLRRRISGVPLHPLARWVPAWFHLFFAFCFIATGIWRENKWLTILTAVNLLIGFTIHSLPAERRAAKSAVPPPAPAVTGMPSVSLLEAQDQA